MMTLASLAVDHRILSPVVLSENTRGSIADGGRAPQ
jgi:hypothetical protein